MFQPFLLQMLLIHQRQGPVEVIWEVTGQWTIVEMHEAVLLVCCPPDSAASPCGPGEPGTVRRERRGKGEGVGGQGWRIRRRVNWCLGLGHFFAVMFSFCLNAGIWTTYSHIFIHNIGAELSKRHLAVICM